MEFIKYEIIFCTLETNITLQINYTSLKGGKRKN